MCEFSKSDWFGVAWHDIDVVYIIIIVVVVVVGGIMNANKGFPKTLLCVDYIDRVVDRRVMRNICMTPKAIHLLYDGNGLSIRSRSNTHFTIGISGEIDFRKSFKWNRTLPFLTMFWLLFGTFSHFITHSLQHQANTHTHMNGEKEIRRLNSLLTYGIDILWIVDALPFPKQCVLNNIDTHNEICQFQLKKKSNLLRLKPGCQWMVKSSPNP